MFEWIRCISVLFCFFPAGIIISILTVRLSSRNVASKSLPRFWNTLVKCSVSYFVWSYLIFLRWSDGLEFVRNCNLSAVSYWMSEIDGNEVKLSCSPSDALRITLLLILRSLLFAMGAQFGASLQPIGLTGGIACGKSTVSRLLRNPSMKNKHDEFTIIDVDAIAHDILVAGKMGADCGYNRILRAFSGYDIVTKPNMKNSPIDRRKLGDIIFQDKSKRKILNSITHPLISKIMMKMIISEGITPSLGDAPIVSVDIPLLFEVGIGMRLLFGIKIVVGCDKDIQLKRLMDRDKDLIQEQCEGRIMSQIPIEEKAKMGDIVIWNNGTMDDLVLQVECARREVINRTSAFLGITVTKCIAFACVLTITSCLFEMVELSDLGWQSL